jgi:indole-3-glycerol phosphate synthase
VATRGSGGEGADVSGVLDAIVAAKELEIGELLRRPAVPRGPHAPRRNVASSLRRERGEPLRLIAENKRRSPSAGALSTALSTADRVTRYAASGAAMVSVLSDAGFFGGSWDDVVAARGALARAGSAMPVLAKEFVSHARPLEDACACGADAVLLIARILDRKSVAELHARAASLGLESLVEVVTEEELEWALEAGAELIGVNARDLDTLVMDAERAAQVLAAIPAHCIPVYLSGLKGPDDVRRIAATHAHAALIGETLMREDDPAALLGAMVLAAQT